MCFNAAVRRFPVCLILSIALCFVIACSLGNPFAQLQEIRTYYDFVHIDNDRYWIDGTYRQVSLSPRELNPNALPGRNWINEYLTYTHGYGLCLGPVNEFTSEGLPVLFVKDLPPASSVSRARARSGSPWLTVRVAATRSR